MKYQIRDVGKRQETPKELPPLKNNVDKHLYVNPSG